MVLIILGSSWRHQGLVTDKCPCPVTRLITTGDLELSRGIESNGAGYTQSPLFRQCGWLCEFSLFDASEVYGQDVRQI